VKAHAPVDDHGIVWRQTARHRWRNGVEWVAAERGSGWLPVHVGPVFVNPAYETVDRRYANRLPLGCDFFCSWDGDMLRVPGFARRLSGSRSLRRVVADVGRSSTARSMPSLSRVQNPSQKPPPPPPK